jgi:hypothetical protein
VTQGEDQIGEYHKNERSYRQWCKVCGGHLLTRHPEWGLVDVYAATIPTFPFTPEVHVNYESTVLPMKDGPPSSKTSPRLGRLRRDSRRVATPSLPAGQPDVGATLPSVCNPHAWFTAAIFQEHADAEIPLPSTGVWIGPHPMGAPGRHRLALETSAPVRLVSHGRRS